MQNLKNSLSRGMIILIIVMAALILASAILGVIVIVNTVRNNHKIITPDYAPEELEPNVEKIEGEEQGGDKMETVGGGGGALIIWKEECIIDLSDEKATFYYANPANSTVSAVLKIKIHDEIIAVSGRIDPGFRLQSLDLLKGAKSKLGGPGGYEGEILLEFYDETTGEKSLVNTALPFTITVKE